MNYNHTYKNYVSRPLYKLTQIVWYILYIIEVILFFRFFLELINANKGAGFTEFVYNLSQPFIAPFIAVLNPEHLNQYVISWNTLLAMLVYWFIAWIIIGLLLLVRPVNHTEAENGLHVQDRE